MSIHLDRFRHFLLLASKSSFTYPRNAHTVYFPSVLDTWKERLHTNLPPKKVACGCQYLSFFCRSFSTFCWMIRFLTSFDKRWLWSSSNDCSHCASLSAFSFCIASERNNSRNNSVVFYTTWIELHKWWCFYLQHISAQFHVRSLHYMCHIGWWHRCACSC